MNIDLNKMKGFFYLRNFNSKKTYSKMERCCNFKII